jgi:hypothetical protein
VHRRCSYTPHLVEWPFSVRSVRTGGECYGDGVTARASVFISRHSSFFEFSTQLPRGRSQDDSRCLPLCDPGHRANNERQRFARCQQIAQEPPDPPLLHHRLALLSRQTTHKRTRLLSVLPLLFLDGRIGPPFVFYAA